MNLNIQSPLKPTLNLHKDDTKNDLFRAESFYMNVLEKDECLKDVPEQSTEKIKI